MPMGTTQTIEEKLSKLREVLNEYVGYLKVWGTVSIELVTRTEAPVNVEQATVEDKYGRKQEELRATWGKIPPSPYVRVVYSEPKNEFKSILQPGAFESKEFPLCHLDKQLVSYRAKLKRLQEKE